MKDKRFNLQAGERRGSVQGMHACIHACQSQQSHRGSAAWGASQGRRLAAGWEGSRTRWLWRFGLWAADHSKQATELVGHGIPKVTWKVGSMRESLKSLAPMRGCGTVQALWCACHCSVQRMERASRRSRACWRPVDKLSGAGRGQGPEQSTALDAACSIHCMHPAAHLQS